MGKVIGGKIPQKEYAKLKVEDALDYAFDRLIFARQEAKAKDVRADCLFLPEDMGPMWLAAPRGQDEVDGFFGPGEINSPDLVWPVSVGTCWPKRDEEWGEHILCNYWQSIPAKKLRGRFKNVGSRNLALYQGYLHSGNKFIGVRNVATWAFGKWQPALPNKLEVFDRGEKDDPIYRPYGYGSDGVQVGESVAVGQSIALTYRYEWGAQFSVGGSVKLIIPTTPRGILELFNDRNKPVDRDRRAALRHWVSQHARKRSSGNFTHVRSHLRGAMNFSWRGFDVEIKPSQFDEERNEVRYG